MYTKKIVSRFNKKANEWLVDLRLLDKEVIQIKPTEKSWSLAEVYDHVMRVSRSYQIPNLKELVLCVLKMKHLNILNADAAENTNNTPFAAIINFVRQNIYNTISIEDLLQISCMSKSTFYRAFVDQLGISPYQLIINERLKIAKNLLLEERLSIKETAYASGFSSPNYFIRLFKKHEGITPKQFVNSKLNTFL